MEAYDPKTLEKCSVYRPVAEVETDWQAFAEDVYAARVKHRIPDVVICARLAVQYEDGGDGEFCAKFSCGDESHQEMLAAYLFGAVGAERQERIARIVADATKQSIRRRKDRK